MWAWEFVRLLYLAEAKGWTKFISMQDFDNLVYREEEKRFFMPLSPKAQAGSSGPSPAPGRKGGRGKDKG
ncbi:hypothetical protein BGZ63DRAFT_394282 [Mariannaea sp. PMI_226]|nr:hypothetical protein BGZ63DRAFT_394282 [Mariannaea sp. PMI_226]